MSDFKSLPGFREFYPEAFAQRRFLFQVWRQVAVRFGFREFDGPVLESLELFKAKSGDEIEGQLFSFEDKGGREVSLRPELTPTLARMVGAQANSLKKPIKWFSIGDNFRYERMQKGRLRCFTQLNADILGEPGTSAEIELISLLIQTLQGFGLGADDFYIRISDRNLWMLYLKARGFETEASKILEVLDKRERMPEDAILERLNQIVGEGESKPLLESIDGFLQLKSMDQVSTAFSTASPGSDLIEVIEVRIQEWSDLLADLEAMGLAEFVEMDMSIVRGLAYYTGFVFEAFDRAKENRAIAGGGRYDGLVKKMGGPDMPAVGFGMGDVVLADVLEERGLQPKFVNTIDIFAVIGGDAERPIALADVNLLRQSGFSVDYSFKSQALGKQLKTASASGARLALIYGSEEGERDEVTIRDLVNRAEERVPRNRLLPLLRERLS